MKYVIIIARGSEAYWGSFPDVPGCVVGGDDLNEVAANAPVVLAAHLEGGSVPPARSLAEVLADREVADLLEGDEIFATVAYHAESVAVA
ncbi:MAG: HicB family protein [Verrucomicrobiaceae bacterium]|nr:HicB family protein [Verrucomicrobiaceae bacterium]